MSLTAGERGSLAFLKQQKQPVRTGVRAIRAAAAGEAWCLPGLPSKHIMVYCSLLSCSYDCLEEISQSGQSNGINTHTHNSLGISDFEE